MAKKEEARELDVESAIAQFEVRISGLLPRVGEKVEVANIRDEGDKYVADIVRYHSKDSKERWQVKEGEQVTLVASRARDVQYLKDYIDFLARHPYFNQS